MSSRAGVLHTIQTTKKSQSPKSNITLNRNTSKMQPMGAIQQMMTWLSMYTADDSTVFEQKIVYIVHTLIVFILLLMCFSSSLAYSLKFYTSDFNEAAFAFMFVIELCTLIYFMIAAILMRHQIVNIFTNMSTIYKSSKFNHETFSKKYT